MLTPNSKISESLALVGAIIPASLSGATAKTDWIPVKNFVNFIVTGQVGALTATGTLDCKIQQATSVSGTGAKDITGKAITQITSPNQSFTIDLRSAELDVANGFNFIQVSMTNATAACTCGLTVYGNSKYGPNSSLVLGDQSFSISNLAVTSNVATITCTGHTFAAQQFVNIALASGAGYGTIPTGNYQIASVSTNTFTIAFVTGNISSAAATGTVVSVMSGQTQTV